MITKIPQPTLSSANLSGVQPRLLLVEDDTLVRREIVRLIPDSWSVTEAVDGEGAIRYLWDESFTAIVLDLLLPNLSGYDVIRHLSMRRPELLARTVVLTSVEDVSLAFIDPQTVFTILKKPLNADELAIAIEELARIDSDRSSR